MIPVINWVKNDPAKHNWFTDGSRFLVSLQVKNNKTGETRWEFDVVQFWCDGDEASLQHECGEFYDKWVWDDFEYFALLEGDMPTTKPEGTDE